MAALVEVFNQITVSDSGGVALHHENKVRFAPGVGTTGQRQTVSLAAGFNALTIPTGAKLLVVIPGSAVSLSLKALTGDTAIPLTPATNPLSLDMWLPVSGLISLGILNGGSTVSVDLIWA